MGPCLSLGDRIFQRIFEHSRNRSLFCESRERSLPPQHRSEKPAQHEERRHAESMNHGKQDDDQFFERMVVELLVAMGYGGSFKDAGKAVGKSGDGGIDGVIKEDKLGLDIVVIQAKKWTDNAVGRPAVQSFAGSMEGFRASKGVFITTSTFSKPAIEYVESIQRRIVLIDGVTLANMMIDHGIGVTPLDSYVLKRLDADYFDC